MSNEKNALEAMLEQYDTNNKPKSGKSETAKVYDLKNYFTTYDLKDNEESLIKEIRMLPNPKGGSPLVEFNGHTIIIEGSKKTFACLQLENGTPCPFCEAREALLAEGDAASKELSKKYLVKKMYIAKVIDRNNEKEGVKFWRFNHDYRKEGIFDKIHGVVAGLKKFRDITSPTEGRDLSISINKNKSGVPVISSITPQDSSVLSENEEQSELWLADVRTWEDVYAVRNYEYLKVLVMGGVPVWDKEKKCFVDKNKTEEVNEDATLDSELALQVENVKSNVKAAETVTESVDVEEEESDDLPF